MYPEHANIEHLIIHRPGEREIEQHMKKEKSSAGKEWNKGSNII